MLKMLALAAGLAMAPMTSLPVAAQVAAPNAGDADAAAVAFVEQLSIEAAAVARDRYLSKEARRARFRSLIEQNVALTDLGNRLIRQQIPNATPDEYAAYQAKLPDLLIESYASWLGGYSGAKVESTRAVAQSPAVTHVHSKVLRRGKKPLDAVWQVEKMPDGSMKLSNLTVSGIKLREIGRIPIGSDLGEAW
jgi:phospholipid transport system substrate-binding protein